MKNERRGEEKEMKERKAEEKKKKIERKKEEKKKERKGRRRGERWRISNEMHNWDIIGMTWDSGASHSMRKSGHLRLTRFKTLHGMSYT